MHSKALNSHPMIALLAPPSAPLAIEAPHSVVPTMVKVVAFARGGFSVRILVAQLSLYAFSTTCELCTLGQFENMTNISPAAH